MVNDISSQGTAMVPQGDPRFFEVGFDEFFRAAFGASADVIPFDYQCRLACGAEASLTARASLTSGVPCHTQLIEIPSGCGKTAAAVLAWLWNRVAGAGSGSSAWPRRLVYCLPAGALVDSTVEQVREWLANLAAAFPDETLLWLAQHSPVALDGNGEDADWEIYPEREAIIIARQDQLLSRALNRGFGLNPYHWATHFALVNHDALWVMDGPELMGVGTETSAQLDALRPAAGLGSCRTWWMGEGMERKRFETVDRFKSPEGWREVSLDSAPRSPVLKLRLEAERRLDRADFVLGVGAKGSYAKNLARFARERGADDELTLIVVSTVERAQAVFHELLRQSAGSRGRVALLHESMLPRDRATAWEALRGGGARIVVTNASVEVGSDISARVLITELAPWPALVQRFGRCNRTGEHGAEATAYWIDGRYEKNEMAKPYSKAELVLSRKLLSTMSSVGREALEGVEFQPAPSVLPVLRRKDLLDLFDITPDLCGADVDISYHVVDPERAEVSVYWRALGDDATPESQPRPQSDELCRVALPAFDRFIKLNARAHPWEWDGATGRWQKVTQPRAGGKYLIPLSCGGYRMGVGWTGDSDDKPAVRSPAAGPGEESYDENRESFAGESRSLRDHTEEVIEEARALAEALELPGTDRAALLRAALWHDVGKAHPEFQRMLRSGATGSPPTGGCYARVKGVPRACRRPFFRHELASALAWIGAAAADEPDRDLVAYLIAAHHGRVGLSIRALPEEAADENAPDRLCSRGVWDGDSLAEVDLPGVPNRSLSLDLGLMRMGGGAAGASWVSRMLAVRNRVGVFQLALLQTLLRAADLRTGVAARGKAELHLLRNVEARRPLEVAQG